MDLELFLVTKEIILTSIGIKPNIPKIFPIFLKYTQNVWMKIYTFYVVLPRKNWHHISLCLFSLNEKVSP